MRHQKIIFGIVFFSLIAMFNSYGQEEPSEREIIFFKNDVERLKEDAERMKELNRNHIWTTFPAPRKHSSELSFSKQFENENMDAEKSFIINDDAGSVTLSLSGTTDKGNIQLKLYLPDGKEYQVLDIDNSSDIRWRQSFSLSEENENNYYGKWKIKIKAKNATGNYMFRMISE